VYSASDSIIATEAVGGLTPGRLDSDFAVSPEGSAISNIKLWVPRGRAGMQPALSFQYDSRRGNGLLGVGWSLNLQLSSKITRCRKDHFHDGYSKAINFDVSDPFCLDGQRLVLVSGVHGQDGAEYRTQIDVFSRIVLRAPDELGPTSFTAYTKDGRILTYGPDDESRVIGERVHIFVPPSAAEFPGWTLDYDLKGIVPQFDDTVRYGWLLSKVVDRAGNSMSFSWFNFENQQAPAFYGQPSTEKLLQTIVYTGSERADDLRIPRRQVVFEYEQRPDREDEFVSGLRLWHPARLSRVDMHGPNPNEPGVLKVYSLAYRIGSTGRSLLESITESDDIPPSGVSKPPHRFEYEDNYPEFDDIDTGISDIRTSPGGRSGLPGRIHVMDIDGDGRDDILYVSASRVGSYFFRLASSDSDGRPCFSAEYSTTLQLSTRAERPYPLDFDIDGRAELLTFDDQNDIGNGYGSRYLLSSLVNSFNSSGLTLLPTSEVEADIAEVADVDGDGRPDLIFSFYNENGTPLRNWFYSLNGTGVFGPSIAIPQVAPDDHRLLDVDGDGAVELLTCLGQPGGPVIYGDWYSALRLGLKDGIQPVVTSLRTGQGYLFLDLNGDGLLDVVWEGTISNSLPSVILNSGNGFFPPVGQPFPNLAYFGNPVKRAMDLDLDGRKELIIRYDSTFAPNPVIAVDWNGGTFAVPVPLAMGSICYKPEEAAVFEVLDVDGNGLDDIIMYNNGSLHLYVRKGKKPDLLTRITDSFGATTTISYKPTSDKTVYEPGVKLLSYPQRQERSKMWVVAEHSEDDGKGGANHFLHRYVDGRTDLRLPAFIGFSGYFRTHVETGEVFEADFDLSDRGLAGPLALHGLPVSTRTSTPMPSGVDHVLITHTDYVVRSDTSGMAYFPVALSIREEEGTEDAAYFHPSRQVTILRDVDEYNNLIFSEYRWDTGRRTVTRNIYANRSAEWLVSLLHLKTIQDFTVAGDSSIRRTAFEYDALGFLHRVILEPGVQAAGQWQPLGPQTDGIETQYNTVDRNVDGLVTLATVHDTLMPGPSSRTTRFTYDDVEGIYVIETTNPVGHVTGTEWHSGLGVPILSTDANGLHTTFNYDSFGRLREELWPGNITVKICYLSCSLAPPCITAERTGGIKNRIQFDLLGRSVSISAWSRDDGKEVRQYIAFDSLGRVGQTSMPHFPGEPPRWTFYRYDPLDRLIVAYLPDGTAWNYTYGDVTPTYTTSSIRRTSIRDPRGNTRYLVEDESARVIRGVEFDGTFGVAEALDYGPFDCVVSAGPLGSASLEVTNDRLGRVIRIADPSAGLRRIGYNAFGEIIRVTDAKGTRICKRDQLGRPSRIDDLDGTTTFEWDSLPKGKGMIATISSPFGVQTSSEYDFFGRVAAQRWKTPDGIVEFRLDYDAVGRLKTIHYPPVTGRPRFQVHYRYGKFGQIVSVLDHGGKPFWRFLESDATGLFGSWILGNNVIEKRIENPMRPGYLGRITASHGGVQVQDLSLLFDESGNLQTRIDAITSTTESFNYDGYNRLKRWTFGSPAGAGIVSYNYDNRWNLRQRFSTGAQPEFFSPIPGLGKPDAAALTSFGQCEYDAKGNQFQGQGRTIDFTVFDLPHTFKSGGELWSYLYDGEGHRILKYSGSGERVITVAGMYERRIKQADQEDRYHIILPGAAAAQLEMRRSVGKIVPERTLYLHTDHLGSLRAVTGPTQILDRLAYDPFGRRIDPASPGSVGTPPNSGVSLGFAGHEHDDESGLINMRGRIYDPQLSRFLTPDPIIRNLSRAGSINAYAYVFNNPQTIRDPTGFDPTVSVDPSEPATGQCAGSCEMDPESLSVSNSSASGTGSYSDNVCGGSDTAVDSAPPVQEQPRPLLDTPPLTSPAPSAEPIWTPAEPPQRHNQFAPYEPVFRNPDGTLSPGIIIGRQVYPVLPPGRAISIEVNGFLGVGLGGKLQVGRQGGSISIWGGVGFGGSISVGYVPSQAISTGKLTAFAEAGVFGQYGGLGGRALGRGMMTQDVRTGTISFDANLQGRANVIPGVLGMTFDTNSGGFKGWTAQANPNTEQIFSAQYGAMARGGLEAVTPW
jgi:RHS repeat-associated protein